MADLDRRVRLTIRAEGAYGDDGRFVQGAIVTDETVWCRREDLGSAEDIVDDAGGLVVTSFVNFTIRYRRDVASTRDGLIAMYETLPDGTERAYYIRKVRELPERRKYLEIECGYSSG